MSEQKTLKIEIDTTKIEKTDKRKTRKLKSLNKSGRIDKRKVRKSIKKIKTQRQENKDKKHKPKKPKIKQSIKKEKGKNPKKQKVVDEKKQRARKKTTNVFNIGSYIRNKTKLNVSPGFVDEEIGRIKDQLDMDILEAEQVAKSMGMKTLMEVHAIMIYDFKLPERHKIISCDSCGNAFSVDVEKASKKMTCPFCGQKRYIKID